LTSAEGKAQNTVSAARRHAGQYLDETDPALREEVFRRLLAEEVELRALPEKYRRRIREEEKFTDLLRRAHAAHDSEVDADPGSVLAHAGPAEPRRSWGEPDGR
jgi:tellurite resistance protein TerC